MNRVLGILMLLTAMLIWISIPIYLNINDQNISHIKELSEKIRG